MRFSREETLATADGARLWYAEVGGGDPPLVLCDGLGCDGFAWKHLAPRLASRRRVLRWHYRGHGLSGLASDASRLGIDYAADDLDAILAAAGLESAVVLGHSMGVQVGFELHRRHPSRVRGLIPICGSYGNPLDTVHDDTTVKRVVPYLYRAAQAFPNFTRALTRALLPSELTLQYALWREVDRRLVRREDFEPYFAHLARMDPLVLLRTLQSAADHSAWDHLSRIAIPTLIIAAERDTLTPLWLSERMHRAIRGSELLVVPQGTHTAVIEQPELIASRIERFLEKRFPSTE